MTGPLTDSDNALLRAWRRGELDEASRHAFEMRLFLEPTLLEAAQFDQAFEAGLKRGRRPVAANDAGVRHPRPWGMLMAAAVGALAVLPFVLVSPAGDELRGNVEWVNVDVRRSTAGAEPLLVEPRPSTGVVALELPAPAESSGPFHARLRGIDGSQAVLDVSDLQASDGVLSLAFNRGALPAGVYVVEIRGGANGDELTAAPLSFRYKPE